MNDFAVFRTPKAAQLALAKGDHIITQDRSIVQFGRVIDVSDATPDTGYLLLRLYSVQHLDGFATVRHRNEVWPIDEATFDWASECDWQISAMPADLWKNVSDRIADLEAP